MHAHAQSDIFNSVQEYYGSILGNKDDLKTSTCCSAEAVPAYLRPLMNNIHEEVHNKFYGCGSPVPYALEGCTVLDLGCGSGRDVYTMAQLVGEKGRVIGVDMTDGQLEVAQKHADYHMQKFGYRSANVSFHKGYIEDLAVLGIADNSIDLVTSNCVINLSPDKQKVFSEIFRVLKPGGELYFSDIFCGQRIPQPLSRDPILLGECLGGALYIEDFRRLLGAVGCHDYRLLSSTPIALQDSEIQRKIGDIDFYSMTVRTFNLNFEDRQENYGHSATYLGDIKHTKEIFTLDAENKFQSGQKLPVSGNTAKILQQSRYRIHFDIDGDYATHCGPFRDTLADCCASAPKQPALGCCG